MTQIPDFSDTELAVVRDALVKRYGKSVKIELADSELRLDPDAPVLTPCPTAFWSERNASFVICKVGANQYRC